MKTAYGCKLFGAHQALTGIRDGAVLLHSVVGCNFGSMALHFASGRMTQVRQTCTVISDSEVVFGGEDSINRALQSVKELYEPSVIFLITGCVSDIVQDDVEAAARAFEHAQGVRVIPVEAAGYRGNLEQGFEQALAALAEEMDEGAAKEKENLPVLNILGPGADDPYLEGDVKALAELFGGKARLGTVFADCTFEEIKKAPRADLNLVFGRGRELAKRMEKRFGTPYVCLDYPYGLTGAKKLWECLEQRFALDFQKERESFAKRTAEGAKGAYSYLQALYGLPAAVLGEGARARGLAAFLSGELGMEIEVCAERGQVRDLDDFYAQVRASEAAFLFASSFEQELSEELGIPLLRFDYPVFDRVCLTGRPYIGAEGTLGLLEDILREAFCARKLKGAMYQ